MGIVKGIFSIITNYDKDAYSPFNSQVRRVACKDIKVYDLDEDMIQIKDMITVERMEEANKISH